MPDPDRPNEVAVNELAANELGLEPGDVLKAPTLTPTGLRALQTGANFPGFTGPTLDLAVVGVVRGPDDLIGRSKDATPLVIATPALIKKFGDQLTIVTVTASVVVDDPSAFVALRTLTEPHAARGFRAFAGTADEEFGTGVRDATKVLVMGLLVFAALAGLGGLFAIGQATSRQINQRAEELVAVRAMGMTQRVFAVALSVPAALTLSAGTILGVAFAYATSGLFPLAVARRAEVDPGVSFDPLVLVLSAAFITLIGTAWAYLCARRAIRTRASTRRAQPRFASWLGLRARAAANLGSQRALGSNTCATQGPSRPALVGAAIGIAGVVAIFVIGSSLHATITTPAWWGWNWTSMPDAQNPNDPLLLARLQNDNDLVAVGVLSSAYVQLNGVSTNAVALETTEGSVALPLGEGRLPISSSEIAVGSTTLERIGVDVGGTVAATSSDWRT